MFEAEGAGDWFHVNGEWVEEICDPYDLDPAAVVSSGTDVPIGGCPTGAALALLLAGVQDAVVSDPMVVDRIVGFERLAAWAAAGQVRALAELGTRRAADDPNELPYAVEEIALALSCSRIAAGTKLSIALDLAQRLPAVLAAWEQGLICASRARVFSETTQRLSAPDAAFVEDQLLPAARTLSPARLKALVAALADSLDPRDIEDKHADAAEQRRVIKEPREDGMACLWAHLPADAAATVWAALCARAHADHTPKDQRTADQRRADALTGLATDYLTGTHPVAHTGQSKTGTGTGCGSGASGTDTDDSRTGESGRDTGTGTGRGCDTGCGGCGCGGSGSDPASGQHRTPAGPDTVRTPPRVPAWAKVQVKIPADLLLGRSTEPATLAGHGPIPTSMAIRLAADAQWQRIVYDPLTGALLDVGTTRHDPPPALREFVLTRDRTCTWANCGQPRVDLDHIIPYPQGPTADYNLDAKCRHHHRTKQRWNFHTERHDDGSSTITAPTGHTYHSPPRDHRPPPQKPQPDSNTQHPGNDQADDPPPF